MLHLWVSTVQGPYRIEDRVGPKCRTEDGTEMVRSDPGRPSVRAVDAGIFMGIKIDSSLTISHIFYADDAVFIDEWSNANLT
nr:RNA-directed DNA polymerase, eukaryota [Tanacetum cinerariifolium]